MDESISFADRLVPVLRDVFGELPPALPEVASPYAAWSTFTTVVVPLLIARQVRVLGVSGCQGSGKSSLSEVLAAGFSAAGVPAAAVSIDDFYLGQQERQALAREVHPLLATRGVPGTHDVAWLQQTLAGVRAGAKPVTVPRFDKASDDRAGEEAMTVDVLIVEGWCMGVQPETEQQLVTPINTLEAKEDADGRWRRWVNDQIGHHYLPLWSMLDFWIHLEAPDFAVVSQWRGQAELRIPAAQRMNAAALERFIAHYERLTRAQMRQSRAGPGIALGLDEVRNVNRITAAAEREF